MAQRPKGVVFTLTPLNEGPPLKSSYRLDKPSMTVGRHPTNDIAVPLDSVSRFHARLEERESGLYVVDLDSSNGTYINDTPVSDGLLADQDRVRFGNVGFVFGRAEAPGDEAPAPETGSQVRFVNEDEDGRQSVVQKLAKSDTTQSTIFGAEIIDAASVARARKLLNTLYDFHKELGAKTDEQEIHQTMLDLIFDALPCDRGVILVRVEEDAGFRPACSKMRGRESPAEIAISRTIIERCLSERVAILSRDAAADQRFHQAASVVLHDIRSAMCAPMICRGAVLAICFVDASESRQSFDEADLEFFSSLAAEVAILLDNARMRKEMELKDQLAVIGQTITGMAHNIKNILLLSQGGIELMDACLDKKNYEALDKTWNVIKRGLDRINTMVRDMLEFSRQREASRKPANVNRILAEIIETVRKELENKSIGLITDLDDTIPDRLLDEEGLYKAFLNLVVNASEAVEEGRGRIGVRSRLAPDGSIRVLVQDNGCGIPSEQLSKVFIPFYTTKGSKGTGLGLSMTRKFIDSMGGLIRCKSQEEVGTAFEIVLPPEAGEPAQGSTEVKTALME